MPDQAPVVTPATDEAFAQRQQGQDQALRNYNYLVAHPDEASKYGMDPADFRPKATPSATQSYDPTHAEMSSGQNEQADPNQPASGYSEAGEFARKGLDDAKAFFTQGLFGDAAKYIGSKAGMSPEHADTLSKVVNVVANAAGFIPAKAEEAGGEAIEAMRGAGEDTSTLGKVVEGPPASNAEAPVSPNGETQPATEAVAQPSPQDDFLNKLHKIFNEDVDTQRRGVRPNAVTAADSEQVPTAWLERVLDKPGTALNAEQLFKLEKFAEQKGKDLQGVAQTILQEPDPAKRFSLLQDEYMPQVQAFAQWHAYAKGGEAEAGRSLQIMQALQEAKGYRENMVENFQNMLADDPSNWEKHVLAMGNTNNGKEAAELAVRSTEPGAANGPTWSSNMLRWAMNAGLSSPTLPAKKLMTDAISLGSKVAAYSINGRIFKAPDIPAGMDTAALHGIWEGLADGWKYLKSSYKSGMPEWSIENGVHTGFATDALDGTPAQNALSYMDFLGKRHIQALGEAANAVSNRMELRAQAWKEAMADARGSLGNDASPKALAEAANARYQAKMEVLPKSVRDAALQQTELNTFRNVTDGMKQVEDLRDYADKNLFHIPLARLAMLFFRTPWNLDKFDASLSPLGWLSVAKNWGREGNGMQAAKAALGTMTAGLAVYLHHQGLLTGDGPADPAMRKAWLQNHQEYSIKIGNTWHRIPDVPGTGTLRVAADIGDIYARLPQHDARSMVAGLGVVTARYLEHQPFMNIATGIADYMTQGLRGEDSNAGKSAGDYLSRLAVPAVVNSFTKSVDPIHRQLKDFVSEWKEKIPGYSQTLPPDRNAFGEPHFISGGYKPEDAPGYGMRIDHFLNPASSESVDQNPLYSELERLGIDLPKVSRAIGGRPPGNSPFKDNDPQNNAGYVLNDKQYDRLQVLAGEGKYDDMLQMVKSKDYKNLSDADKSEMLRTINMQHNAMGVARLQNEDPSIIKGQIAQIDRQAAKQSGKVSVATP